jgi:hypothetical protein
MLLETVDTKNSLAICFKVALAFIDEILENMVGFEE